MVHQGQRLPLGFEPGDDRFGVHAQLDDFEGDAAADGLFLFGHINHAAAAFADFLAAVCSVQCGRRAFRSAAWKGRRLPGPFGVPALAGCSVPPKGGTPSAVTGGCSRKRARLFVCFEEGFNVLAQLDIVATSLGEVGGAFGRVCLLQGIGEDFFNQFVAVCIHELNASQSRPVGVIAIFKTPASSGFFPSNSNAPFRAGLRHELTEIIQAPDFSSPAIC